VTEKATATIWSVALAAVVALAAACHAERARPAPFRVRPDSVVPGDLRGPFDGRVVDAASGDAVAGALVHATWTFQRGLGAVEPAGFHEAVLSTDTSGRYTIPRLDDIPGGTRLAGFQLVVYKRGYVAYRSDRRFEDLGTRLDFAQKQLRIPLDRWRADLSHVRHLRYVGGGSALAALTGWERELAAAELVDAHAGPRVATDLIVAGDRLSAAQLLSTDELVAITGCDGTFETGPLNDEPDTTAYSSQHFKAMGQPESFDVALRLWRLGPDEAASRYRELLDGLPGAAVRDEIADRSLRATEGAIIGIGFIDQARGVVVLLTCGTAQCKTPEVAVALARKTYDRIKNLVRAGPTAPAATPPPTPPKPAAPAEAAAPPPTPPAAEAPATSAGETP